MAVVIALVAPVVRSAAAAGDEASTTETGVRAQRRAVGAVLDDLPTVRFPQHANVIDVTQAPYYAKGDGVSDDTDALQRALHDVMGKRKLLYFPAGTYLISRTLLWSKQNADGTEAWGKNFLQGAGHGQTVLRLQDGTFTDPKQPQALMWCGGFGSADWFHNYVHDLTFDVGRGNPGAVGLQFYANNSGAVRNCRFVAEDDSGSIGLDLGHRDMNGPLLVQNCEVAGFARGIVTARAVNGQTFEHITLRGQREVGFENAGQAVSMRGLRSDNCVPAVKTYGTFCLVEAELVGRAEAASAPAIINYNQGRLLARDVHTQGYARAIGDVQTPDSAAAYRLRGPDKPGSAGPHVREYFSHEATSLFPSRSGSLRLPIEEPPRVERDPPEAWAIVDDFGADPTAQEDSSAAIQQAIDSGASTVFFPGSYVLKSTVIVRGKVQRLIGLGSMVDYHRQVKPDFRVQDGEAPVVVFEHFSHIHGGIEIDTPRTLIFRSVADADLTQTPRARGGKLFMEDFVTHNLQLVEQQAWARQLNIENQGTHLLNEASDLWVLGYKTERGGTLLDTRRGGRSEILGGFSYTTTAGKLAPMFIQVDSQVFAYFGEVCFNGEPFETLVQESRGAETRSLDRGHGHTVPYIGIAADAQPPQALP
jgi:hypothetical protein